MLRKDALRRDSASAVSASPETSGFASDHARMALAEIRIMPSTLNPELIPNVTNPLNVDSSSDTIMVWSLDKNAWRDIRSDTITEWKIEHE